MTSFPSAAFSVTIRVDWSIAVTVADSSTIVSVFHDAGSASPFAFAAGSCAHPIAAIGRTSIKARTPITILFIFPYLLVVSCSIRNIYPVYDIIATITGPHAVSRMLPMA